LLLSPSTVVINITEQMWSKN